MLDPKSTAQNSKPRLSFSTKPTVLASRVESDTTINVMKWKTVSTIFLVVVLYLVIGATVFKALEQPHEISQRTTIVIQKQTFISQHSCVNSTELDELIQVIMAQRSCYPASSLGKESNGRRQEEAPRSTMACLWGPCSTFTLALTCLLSALLPSFLTSSLLSSPSFLLPSVPSYPLLFLLSHCLPDLSFFALS